VVLGDDGPAVRQFPDGGLARVEHGFNGENHARLEFQTRTGFAVVEHLGIFVEVPADTVAAEFPYHGKTVFLRILLDHFPDVSQMGAGFHLGDAQPHGIKGDFAEALGLDGAVPHLVHTAGVPVEAVFDDRDIQIDDIPAL